MEMVDLILGAVIVGIVGGAGTYVYKAKKSGKTCIGCPSGGNCGSCCGCSDTKTEE